MRVPTFSKAVIPLWGKVSLIELRTARYHHLQAGGRLL